MQITGLHINEINKQLGLELDNSSDVIKLLTNSVKTSNTILGIIFDPLESKVVKKEPFIDDRFKAITFDVLGILEDLLCKYNIKIPYEDGVGDSNEAYLFGDSYLNCEDALNKSFCSLDIDTTRFFYGNRFWNIINFVIYTDITILEKEFKEKVDEYIIEVEKKQ